MVNLEEIVRNIKGCFSLIYGISDPDINAVVDGSGLVLMGGFDGQNLGDSKRQIVAQREMGVYYLNVQVLNHDTAPAVMAKLAF